MAFDGFKDTNDCIKYVIEKSTLTRPQAERIAAALMTRQLDMKLKTAVDQEEIKALKIEASKGRLDATKLTSDEQQGMANILAAMAGLDDGDIDIRTDEDLVELISKFAIDPSATEEIITEAFITDEDEPLVVSSADILGAWTKRVMPGMKGGIRKTVSQKDAMTQDQRGDSNRLEVSKTASGTTQQMNELGHNKMATDLSRVDIVEPPYPPELLSVFLEVDETHFRCVRTKVTDSVGRDYVIESAVTVQPDKDEERDAEGRPVEPKDTSPIHPVGSSGFDVDLTGNFLGATGSSPLSLDAAGIGGVGSANRSRNGHNKSFRSFLDVAKAAIDPQNIAGKGSSPTQRKRIVTQDQVDDETQRVEDFIEDANEMIGFEGVLDRCAMDYEAVGWGAIEVIRSTDMKVRRIAHAPAVRMRALKGWQGYVEVISNDRADGSTVHRGKYQYYQPFGAKVLSKRINPFTQKPETYDPKIDGPVGPQTAQWNLVDRDTGEPTDDPTRAANEIIWVPRHHSNTIYYGFTDVVPALGWVLANVHIRDYLLQFFEHNTVPRYAIIIEGAKLAEPVKKAITAYFSTHVKGKAHKTLIIPIPSMRGEVKVRFEKLDADVNEASFQDTKKNNAQSIMTAHGVSPAIIGISDKAELGSGKGLSQAEIYKDRIITPSQRYWAGKINRLLRVGLGISVVRIRFNPLDIRDEKAEQEVLSGYLKMGAITLNELRRRAGLGDPLPGGDRPFIVLGNTIMFVDEMTEAMGTEREELESQIEETQAAMKLAAAKSQSQGQSNGNATKPASASGKDKAGTSRTKTGTAKQATTVGSNSGGNKPAKTPAGAGTK